MHKILAITLLTLLLMNTAAANQNDCELVQINSTHWYFVTTQTDLMWGTYGYQAFANNISSDYRTVEYFIPPPTNIKTTPSQTSVYIEWDAVPNADNYSVYELEDGFPYVGTNPIVDGVKDAIYNYSHEFLIFSPNPITVGDYGTIYPVRTALGAYFLIECVDNDNKKGDDDTIYYFDLDNNGLTTNDYAWKITDNIVKRYNWDGVSWKVAGGSNAVGASTGGGTHYPIHELFIPIAELGANWTNGSTVKVLVKREDSSLHPDVITWYPYGNINDTDTSLWQEMVLNDPESYTFLGNTTNLWYNATGLTPFTIYHGGVSAWNGTQETSYALFDVITEDIPIYSGSGYIFDTLGNPIEGATVYSCNGFVVEITTSNASGHWIGYNFRNNTYTICANATNALENSISVTFSGANLTNQNITLNYYNFSYTDISATSPIKDGETSTVLVDVTDYDGTIQSVIVKIEGTNYTMQNTAGNTWRYFYTDTSIVKKHYITDIYAQDTASAWNSTTSSVYIDVVAAAGEGNAGGFPPITIPELPEVLLEIPLPAVKELVPIITNITESINETIHLVGDIISADGISMLKLNTDVGEVKFVKEVERVGAVDCSSSDPMVQCGVLNDKVIIIVIPELTGSIYNRMDSHVSIEFEDGALEYTKFTIIVLDAMGYLVINPFFYDNPNPYLFEVEPPSDAVVGVRYWWPTSIGLLGMFVGRRYYGK